MLRGMNPWRWHLPVLLFVLLPFVTSHSLTISGSAPLSMVLEPLTDVVAMHWVPRQGRLYVQSENGQSWHVFDHMLKRVGVQHEDPGIADLVVPLECADVGKNHTLQVVGPGGRNIRWQVDTGMLLRCVADWEDEGQLQWGPGWATLEFRSAHWLGPWLQWRDGQGVQHMSKVVVDNNDPLLQRVYLQGLFAGANISIRHRPVALSYPQQKWSEWIDLQVPQVDPSGQRPTLMLHSTICGLRRVEPPR
jgi:hypothetical protein